ncbi:MAG: CDP-alcohol phosphatidyltransferase family protein [Thaumarchaeota archaeon]|nr:CDP-alcohol phosphatidyltransferase family protein [Nitrososphaerota archaeon]
MVLNNVRARIEPVMTAIGKALSPVSPNTLTALGALLAVLAGIFYAIRPNQPYLAAILIIASGVFDMFDGAVARVTGKVSKAGSFNDSTLDRLAEIAIYAGILYGSYGLPGYIIVLTLGFSLLVSYIRAKGESLNLKISGVGVGERAERLIVLIVFSLIFQVAIGVYIVLILAVVTCAQRYVLVSRKLNVK